MVVIKKNPEVFLRDLKKHYDVVVKMPSSEYLKKPNFVVVDPKSGKKVKVSFIYLDDGEFAGVVYDDSS
ncbi:hypothetical protein PFDSM3638_06720 [Pyrococcus furiosus DSM 3638]|uniref:Uncharacterized protein n=3 Tax=Pyrococcus furiosus TaxID=2261 RepID=Q8U179_PYRFU|nr:MULTISPECIES: hypothetical protein [Pyrococcus]AAL81472.1 hypothetical protein PF1348 [Pyrococcus furiosus DSM 3638]AFN04128.1 hypothetical protein PFC_05955 [Pyrococcus furiosus COM1]QEK78983.1 hypothetical protein PFDSM3638_06720 [Pyrococcus furiosus DSM 3638]